MEAVTGNSFLLKHINMKHLTYVIITLLLFAGCQKQSNDHEHTEDSPNQALYDEVMGVHDEVMPKMNDIQKAKATLQTRLELPGISEAEKQEISSKITELDSASEGMMVWMRQFDPIADSVGVEKARTYLEGELVKVKKVREDILRALEASQ